jgi:undecaprenyl diphosphate synthase
MSDVSKHKLPESVAIIMDGNGRWALRRSLPRSLGHKAGAKTAERIVRYARDLGIKYLTLFAFSSENWGRPQDEIDAVLSILNDYLKNNHKDLIKHGIRVLAIGDLKRLPAHLNNSITKIIADTRDCNKLIITLALSYGSHEEIVDTCKTIAQNTKLGKIDPSDINESYFAQNLYTKNIVNPDLFIRTSGEIRLSNFLLWQLSYSELYFTDTLWPDFQVADFDKALEAYASRNRRFGKVS